MEHRYKQARHSAKNNRDGDDWDEVHHQLLEVQQMGVQKKSLNSSQPGDAAEKEADEIAHGVVNSASIRQPVQAGTHQSNRIQRQEEFKATDRITGNGKDLLFSLVDKNGNQLRYDNEDNKQGPIFLPEGTQVVKLSENPENKDYVKVIVWMSGKYREGFVAKAAFGGSISEDSPFVVDAFINDAERTLHNSEMVYEELMKGYAEQDRMMAELNSKSDLKNQFIQQKTKFREEVEKVRTALSDFKEGKLKITPAILKSIAGEDKALMSKNKTDQPGLIQNLSDLLYSTYNPEFNGKTTKQATVFVPLPPEWLQAYVPGFYKRQWSKRKNSYASLSGNAGYVLSGEQLKKFVALLMTVKRKIAKEKTAAETPVGKWLLNTDFSSAERLIIIEDKSWTFDNSQRYASRVPLNTSFGMLHANPVLTLMAHEMNMATSYTMGETHMDEEETKTNWGEADAGGLSAVKGDGRKMDSLFQAHSSTSMIILSTYFKRIRDKQ